MVVILQVNRETKNVHKTDIPVPAKFINILDYLRKIWWQRFCLIIKYSSRHGTKYETISSYNYVHTCILGHLPLVRNTGVLWHLLTPPTPARLMLAFELRDAQAPPLSIFGLLFFGRGKSRRVPCRGGPERGRTEDPLAGHFDRRLA